MPFPITQSFRGFNSYLPPGLLPENECQRITNLFNIGGKLISRPGKQGLWDVALTGGPIYALTSYRNSAGESWLVFAADRKLYKWKVGSTVAPTEIKDAANGGASFNFPLGGKFVQMVRFGRYLVGTDATGPIFRTDLTIANSGSYGGQLAPTVRPVASLTSTTLDATDDVTKWAGFAAPSPVITNLLLNPGFEAGGAGVVNGGAGTLSSIDKWTQIAGDSIAYSARVEVTPRQGSYSLLVNDANDILQQKTVGALPTVSFGGTLTPRTARVYTLRVWVHQADTDGQASLLVTISALGASDAVLAAQSTEITQPHDISPGSFTYHDFTASFWDLAIDPLNIAVTLTSGGQGGSSKKAIYVDECRLVASDTRLTPITFSTTSLSAKVTETNTFGASAPHIAGQWLRRDYSSAPKDFTVSNRVSVAISIPQNLATSAGTYPRFRFGFVKAGDTAITWSNTCTYSGDNLYISADISTIPKAIRQASTGFFLQVLDSLVGLTSNSTAFTFGPVTAAGNLSVGFGDYFYLYSESATPDSGNPGDFIESSGSPYSTAVTPTEQQAQTIVVLSPAAPVNAATGTYPIYRLGGALNNNDDPYPRLVATVPVGANATGNGWRWEYLTRTFYDNVPDSALLLAQIYEKNRDSFPSGITCLCVTNGRLFAAKGNTIYASWLQDSDAEAALYTSLITDPTDASLAIKGGAYPLDSINNKDAILSLVPLPTAILVLRENSLNILNGYGPENFATVNVFATAGIGCIAQNSTVVDGNAAYYVSASGVMRYNAADLTPESLPLQGVLNPRGDDGEPIITPAAYAGCAHVYHDRRRYLFAPVAGGSQNSVCYVFDTRTGGYTTFAQMNIASACSLSSAADRQDLFLGGTDGMLYTLRGSVDKATRLAAGAPITVEILSREYGNESPDLNYFYENRAQKYYFSVESEQTAAALTLTAIGSTAPGNVWSHAYETNTAPGPTTAQVRVAPNIRGERLTQGLIATVSQRLTIFALGLMTSEGRKLP